MKTTTTETTAAPKAFTIAEEEFWQASTEYYVRCWVVRDERGANVGTDRTLALAEVLRDELVAKAIVAAEIHAAGEKELREGRFGRQLTEEQAVARRAEIETWRERLAAEQGW